MVIILSEDLSQPANENLNTWLMQLQSAQVAVQRGSCVGSHFILVPEASDELQLAAAAIPGVKAVFPIDDLPIVARLLQQLAGGDSLPPESPIAFQGARGAYSEIAIRQFFGIHALAIPCAQFRDVFSALEKGIYSVAVLPLENALTGSIHENYDLLLEYPNISICGEIHVRINHNLIGLPGSTIGDIRRVYSHPQGLLQSAAFLRSHSDWEQMPFYDTAGSVAYIKECGLNDNAAIASTIAAEVYGMSILESSIETNPHNYTRFGIMVRNDSSELPAYQDIQGLKASIVFSLPHQPKTLLNCLQILGDQDLNLTKIESRPIHGQPWEYMFYIDVEINSGIERFQLAISILRGLSENLRVLGVFPLAKQPG